MRHAIARRPRTAPKYKWCGHAALQTLLTHPSTTTSQVQLPCPSLGNTEIQGEVIVERIIINFAIRRLLTSAVGAVGFLVAKQKVIPTTGAPLVVLDPLETTSDNFEFGSKDIFLMGLLPVPQCVMQFDANSLNITQETVTKEFEFNGRRRLERLTHAMTLTLTADFSSAVSVFTQMRVLLRFS